MACENVDKDENEEEKEQPMFKQNAYSSSCMEFDFSTRAQKHSGQTEETKATNTYEYLDDIDSFLKMKSKS